MANYASLGDIENALTGKQTAFTFERRGSELVAVSALDGGVTFIGLTISLYPIHEGAN